MSAVDNLFVCLEQIRVLEEKMQRLTRGLWPEGAAVRFRIQSNHFTASTGTVLSHDGRGMVNIVMASGHRVRVSFEQVLS